MATPAAPKMTDADYRAAMGPLIGLLSAVPELKGILSQAVSGQWTAAKFQQQVQKSNWFRTHADTVRQQVALRVADPATYNNNINLMVSKVTQAAQQIGVTGHFNAASYKAFAQQALMSGWTDADIAQHLGMIWAVSPGSQQHLTGQAVTNEQQINQMAADYGIPISGATMRFYMGQVMSGAYTLDTVKQSLMNHAKTAYPPLAQQIDAGMTVKDIAQPYVDTMAKLLEVDPASVDVNNTVLIKKALQNIQPPGPKTQAGTAPTAAAAPAGQPMPLWQFEQQVKADPRWQYTGNAHDEMANALHQVGTDMGYGSY